MATGIKESKVVVFDITYHTFPESGDSTIDKHDDYYIVGVNEKLPGAKHVDKYTTEIDDYLTVYLQDMDDGVYHTWNKVLNGGIFSEPIKETENEFGDLDLKAKWSQYLRKGIIYYNPNFNIQENLKIDSGDLIFKWSVPKE